MLLSAQTFFIFLLLYFSVPVVGAASNELTPNRSVELPLLAIVSLIMFVITLHYLLKVIQQTRIQRAQDIAITSSETESPRIALKKYFLSLSLESSHLESQMFFKKLNI
jgi:hypothetical protein